MAVGSCAAYVWSSGVCNTRCSTLAGFSAHRCLNGSTWFRVSSQFPTWRTFLSSYQGGVESRLSSLRSAGSPTSAAPVRTRGEVVKFEAETRLQSVESDTVAESDSSLSREVVPSRLGFPPLENKAKKELRAYAHGLGSRLNVQQVGKLGVSQTVVNSISDALEANEIVKIKVMENCPTDMTAIMGQLEWGTGGQIVGKIGRTMLLYRASLRKLADAEKRLENQRQENRRVASPRGPAKSKQKSRRPT